MHANSNKLVSKCMGSVASLKNFGVLFREMSQNVALKSLELKKLLIYNARITNSYNSCNILIKTRAQFEGFAVFYARKIS